MSQGFSSDDVRLLFDVHDELSNGGSLEDTLFNTSISANTLHELLDDHEDMYIVAEIWAYLEELAEQGGY